MKLNINEKIDSTLCSSIRAEHNANESITIPWNRLTLVHRIAYYFGFARGLLGALVSFVLVSMLSACGGGGAATGDIPTDFHENPIRPPAALSTFARIGMDMQLFANTENDAVGPVFDATIDSSANIRFKNNVQAGAGYPTFNYDFTFASGLPGGFVTGDLFRLFKKDVEKEIAILAPRNTKYVQNVIWGDSDQNTFGIGLVGYPLKLNTKNWPKTGQSIYAGKAFQYIIDSNAQLPANTTYALYSSDVTASVNYSAKTIVIAVSGSPTLIYASKNATVVDVDPMRFASIYQLRNLDLSGASVTQHISGMLQHSGLGLSSAENALAFFGNDAEELAGFIRYVGHLTSVDGLNRRNQFISFALAKQ